MNDFFRNPDDMEKALITEYEERLYKRQCISCVFLMLIFAFSFIIGLVSLFIPTGLGKTLSVFMIAAGIVFSVICYKSILIIKRQLQKIRDHDYMVQEVTITDVHNEIHGVSSDQIVTFTSDSKATYVMNTKTTGDQGLTRGKKGLLVIINGEENILLTCKYRFYPATVRRAV